LAQARRDQSGSTRLSRAAKLPTGSRPCVLADFPFRSVRACATVLSMPGACSGRVWSGLVALCASALVFGSQAAPAILNYRGNMTVNGHPFDGKGWFTFAIVDNRGAVLWASGESPPVGQTNAPNGAIPLHVRHGNYSVRLGDTANAMPTLDDDMLRSAVNPALRIWFHDGIRGWHAAAGDVPLAPIIADAQAVNTSSNKPRSSPDAVMQELQRLRSRVGRQAPMPPNLPSAGGER
jgi:hypothetical protein